MKDLGPVGAPPRKDVKPVRLTKPQREWLQTLVDFNGATPPLCAGRRRVLKNLEAKGLATLDLRSIWRLTPAGIDALRAQEEGAV